MRQRGFRLEHFRTKLGRKIVSLFLVCALLPTGVLSFFSYQRVRIQLRDQSMETMETRALNAQMGALERLQSVESELILMAASPMVDQALAGKRDTPSQANRLRRLSALTLFAEGETTPLVGNLTVVPQLSPQTLVDLDRGRTALEVVRRAGARQELLMARALDRDDGRSGVLWGRIVADSLWSTAQVYAIDITGDEIDLQDDKGFCVLDGALQPLDCAGAMVSWTDDGLPESINISDDSYYKGSFSWVSGGERFAGQYRVFPLSGFSSEGGNWTVLVGRGERGIIEPLTDFRRMLLSIFVLTLAVVLGLSAHRIRQIMEPLAALRSGTQRIAANDFAARVNISSGDEFEELATSFNDMASQVGSLVEDLEELSWSTITTLARTIDAKSPWTAGHSERVTTMAIRIGRELGLPEKDLERLHRGGLLHDIGKIGVPASIIDKEGPLTDSEWQKMRDHVTIGARILEPLTPLADVIPIVLYHHERWDGKGYPDGLAGTDIPWLARILCVADTYDAMRSDRPYRTGLGPDETLEEIAMCSGSQFDADAVLAFVDCQVRAEKETPALESVGSRLGAPRDSWRTAF